MDANSEGKLPASFWVIAVLGLLWNSFGAYLYILARVDPETALAGASPEMRDYVASQPIWANLGYGLGIWGSFLGSVAMVAQEAGGAAVSGLAGRRAGQPFGPGDGRGPADWADNRDHRNHRVSVVVQPSLCRTGSAALG